DMSSEFIDFRCDATEGVVLPLTRSIVIALVMGEEPRGILGQLNGRIIRQHNARDVSCIIVVVLCGFM
ncbi:hypothetical protein, partial [Providencia sp. PROV187]